MPKIFRPKYLGALSYASGQTQTLPLDLDGVLTQINLRVTFTITSGSSAMVGALFQTLARVLKRVEITMGGRDTVLSASGAMLAARAHYEFGVPARGMDDTFVLTGSTTVTAYDITIPIPLYLPRARVPDDTGLDLRRVRQATLAVTWCNSDLTDLVTTVNSAAFSVNPTLQVEGEYFIGTDADMPPTYPAWVREIKEITQDLPATDPAYKLTIDGRTGLAIRSVMFATLVANVGNASILSAGGIRVESGSMVFAARKGPAIIAENRAKLGIATPITGVYHMPFIQFGELNQSIATQQLPADLNAYLDATKQSGVNTIIASVESVRPLKLA